MMHSLKPSPRTFFSPSFSRSHRQRMDSVSSTDSRTSESPCTPTRAAFIPFTHKVQVPQEEQDELIAALDTWRTEKQARRAGGRSLLSKRVDLSDSQLQKLADHGADFLRETTVTPELICKFVPWDLASREDLKAVASIIMDWRVDARLAIDHTPRAGHRQKQQNTMPTPPRGTSNGPLNAQTITQPSITQPPFSPARMQRGRGHPCGRGRGRGQGRGAGSERVSDADFFAPMTTALTTTAPIPSRTVATRSTSAAQSAPLHSQSGLSVSAPSSNPTQPLPPNAPFVSYYPAACMYPHPGSFYSPMYPMYSLPLHYYPPAPNTQGQNN
jgi:hypothetical protein